MVARRGGVGYESAAGKKRLEEFKRRKEAKKKVNPPKPVKKAKDKITGKGAIRTKDGQLNVTKRQIDDLGMTLTQYVNYFNKHGKRPTAKVTTGPRSGDTSKQPVMAGRRAPRSGDTTTHPVMAGKATSQRALRSGDTSKQPVMAGSVRDAREARHPQSQYRKMMRDRLKNRQKMSKGGTAQVSKSKGSNFKGIY